MGNRNLRSPESVYRLVALCCGDVQHLYSTIISDGNNDNNKNSLCDASRAQFVPSDVVLALRHTVDV